MRDPVDRVLAERAGLDRGLGPSVWLSLAAHFLIVGSVFGAQLVIPKPPPIQVADGFAVVLPRGGGGVPDAPPPAPSPERPPSEPVVEAAPEPEPPPEVIKPPAPEREPERRGLPEPEATPERRSRPTPPPASAGVLPGGTGTGTQTPGVSFAPAGPGIPDGVDRHGDWYLAGVQRKIWMIWTQQINPRSQSPVRVQFTILADGSVQDVRVVQSSGGRRLDLAAQRAVMSAAPFGPFPREYGGVDRITIQANFKPSQ